MQRYILRRLVTAVSAARKPPSAQHTLGIDNLGRDVLSRIIYGLRVSLLVSLASVALGISVGML